MSEITPHEELLTAEQLGEKLRVRKWAILDWRKEGIITAEICRGRVIKFSEKRVREELRRDAVREED